tara:strand:+ start:31 stop:306 length:276 start_codon:yes stop_codon:yes gene_type:complete
MLRKYTHLTGKMATLQHSSKISQIVLEMLDTESYSVPSLSESEARLCASELDSFMHDTWLLVGDTEFNRSGLRNATDSLIDFFKKKGYDTN